MKHGTHVCKAALLFRGLIRPTAAIRIFLPAKNKKDEERKNRGSSYEDELAEEAKKAAEFVIKGKSATDSKEDLFNAPLPIKGIRKTIELS